MRAGVVSRCSDTMRAVRFLKRMWARECMIRARDPRFRVLWSRTSSSSARWSPMLLSAPAFDGPRRRRRRRRRCAYMTSGAAMRRPVHRHQSAGWHERRGTGDACARKLRPEMPVVYASGPLRADRATCTAVPGSIFMPKPYDPRRASARLLSATSTASRIAAATYALHAAARQGNCSSQWM